MKRYLIPITLLLFWILQAGAVENSELQTRLGEDSSDLNWQVRILEQSIRNLDKKYPNSYDGERYLRRLNKLKRDALGGYDIARKDLDELKKQALLAHPMLKDASILGVKMAIIKGTPGSPTPFYEAMNGIGLPAPHLSISSVPQTALAGGIVKLSSVGSTLEEELVVKPRKGEPVAGLDLNWNGDRLLFARRANESWKIYEVNVDGSNLRQVSQHDDDISSHEPCYLPNGDIVFASDANTQGVPCWHGIPNKVANLYTMDRDGKGVRQLCYDQGHNAQPTVLKDGRVVFNRWDYTGMNRVFNRVSMEMRPDGTGQKAFFGTNTWYPNGVYGHKELPGSRKLVCIVGGYHDGNRCGYLGILDPSKGDRGDSPLVKIITGTQLGPKRIIEDKLTQSVVPLFTDPDPVDDEYFLVSVMMEKGSYEFGIYLADVFGNLVLIKNDDDYAYLKPALLRKRETPKVIPSLVNLEKDDATVYIQDVYMGPGLKEVERGVIKKVRVVGYDYGYPTLAGVDKIGMTGPWDVMQMIGEAKVHADGSAFFKIPADTPVAFQLIDEEGQAVQLMRTWTTAMPGERMSCVGCHEESDTAPLAIPTMALRDVPQDLYEWFGPARGFDFAREIQPVLNKNCVSCHDGGNDAIDLRPKDQVPGYVGTAPSWFDYTRLNQKYKDLFDGKPMVPYTPAYEALVPYIRRVGAGDDVSLLVPGEYKANTSPLIQILKKGHHGLELSAEDLERFYAWIDLNGPSHGTWKEVYGVTPADGMYELRRKYKDLYGSKQVNLDTPEKLAYDETPIAVKKPKGAAPVSVKGWPFDASSLKLKTMELDIGDGETITLSRLPASAFVMGDEKGLPDEFPLSKVDIRKTYWMSETEISNEQFRIFKAEHDSRYYSKRHVERTDNQGIPMDHDDQPAIRVSWNDAMDFCKWLSAKTGMKVNLPTEAQWEFACRAGSDEAFSFGALDGDYSKYANVADKTFATGGITGRSDRGLFVIAADLESLISEGVDLADRTFDDKTIVTAAVDQFRPNAFGLKNMHGNVAEWTRSLYKAYPYDADDGRNDESAIGDRVVRGGSFFDPPQRSRSAFRLAYPAWQGVHNVGFRIVIEGGSPPLLSMNEHE
ncbi:MAG: SUMF1/EgtB/PvdO family nonheme iron enzyme [Opitutales bacterium]|jgi:formylglycine-generating enzyme required for sulfatase activity|nr:SUMF1/EgtB/PvdO family nonheme iron enzyme [Opitutales bacterium]MBT5814978.1 SUMF1/EgtB/PvdO family nonheme iron enzyme [Opitutales bacterium]